MKETKFVLKVSVLFIVVLLFISCAVNPVTGKTQLMLMSESQELALGQSYDPQVIATFGDYKDDDLLAFVQTKSNEMGLISHRPKVAYHLRVLDSPVINAFAVPGGYIYLTRGILAQLNSEAELMGVVGHEMGHICARHTASQQTKQTLGQLVLMGGMIASEKFAQYAQYAMQGMQLLFLKFSRDDERMADKLGVEYSSKIGYDAHQMAEFFKVLYKMNLASNNGGVPTFLSTHPDPGDRYNSVNQSAAEWQTNLKSTDWKINSDNYLKLINGIVYGEDPRQGYVENNIFYHPEMKFKFSYPAGWQFENSPLQVTMAPSDGKAMIVFTLSRQKTLKAASDTTIKDLSLTPVESSNITVNGMPALATVNKQTTQDQTTGATATNEILSYYINYDNIIYVFHGMTAEADFNTYSGTLKTAMGSFSKLTDAAKINVKPKKIIVRSVTKAGTLADTFTSFGVKQSQMAELALLNNMELTDRVAIGKQLKIVGE
jgi:predicted Zn-dependent protease